MITNQKNMEKLPPLQFNIPNMMRVLHVELPKMPEELVVKQENPPAK